MYKINSRLSGLGESIPFAGECHEDFAFYPNAVRTDMVLPFGWQPSPTSAVGELADQNLYFVKDKFGDCSLWVKTQIKAGPNFNPGSMNTDLGYYCKIDVNKFQNGYYLPYLKALCDGTMVDGKTGAGTNTSVTNNSTVTNQSTTTGPCPCDCQEVITEETWYIGKVCTQEPCYPMTLDVSQIECKIPEATNKYDFDCTDLDAAIAQMNNANGVKGLRGMSNCGCGGDCNCGGNCGGGVSGLKNSGAEVATGLPPQNNQYVLSSACVPANKNWGLWLLVGTVVTLALTKIVSK
jgi:hypothetical protein